MKRKGPPKCLRRVHDAWLYSTSRTLWLSICGLLIGTFFVLACVMPAYFAGYNRNSACNLVLLV